ncbi:MAG: rod shape-determining protein [Succinivibrionaceae bacterium]|jgi:rod shape-determining protein MreB|nr:rod shape-determining protein [Succinivibrionaceae bacterium]MCI6199443.1 rod shape-determining protein [Pseudomonadota bacterium]MDD6547045.1 rod shape-determining protein [Pseudomonadota bacterium]MDY3143972.1 rod shape-determining protein [Succinivibrionaceae bacterium]MDY6273848.1 rod shape-determining protein [Succinivibrionaceae bacterium]
MFSKLFGMFSNDFSIDLGTANTIIYARGRGIVLNEPSVVAIRTEPNSAQRTVQAVGLEAKRMLGKTPGNLQAIRPMKNGVISDFDNTGRMLQEFIAKVRVSSFFKPKPRVLVCVPCGSTQVERKSIVEVAKGAGASKVILLEEPMAAAIGAGLPVAEATGSMIIDIGGGTTEVAIISLNGIVERKSIDVGGDKFDEAIINYIGRKGKAIGEATAERIKMEIGSASPLEEELEMEVRGLDKMDGTPCSFKVNSTEILDALQEPLNNIVNAVKDALEHCKPELSADIAQSGMCISGGGALLRNIDALIRERTSVPTFIAEDPLTCVARGGGKALELLDAHPNQYDIFIYDK